MLTCYDHQKFKMDDHNDMLSLLSTYHCHGHVIIGPWRYKDIDEHHHAAKEDL